MHETHTIELRDVITDDDPRCPDEFSRCLLVSYNARNVANETYTESRHVSTRLPVECLVLFTDGAIDVADLTAEERDWVESESAAVSNRIDFAGTETGEVAL